jgi:hypothetical protein
MRHRWQASLAALVGSVAVGASAVYWGQLTSGNIFKKVLAPPAP